MEEYRKKVLLLGDAAVGKTSLIRKFVYDRFDDSYITTVGTKVSKKTVQLSSDVKVDLNIWDVLGQQDYTRVQQRAFQGANGILLVCDLTNPRSVNSWGSYWLPQVAESIPGVPIVCLGNKVDLTEERKILPDDLKDVAKELSAPLYETSALKGDFVEEAFSTMCNRMILPIFPDDKERQLETIKRLKKESEGREVENIYSPIIDEIITEFMDSYTTPENAMPLVQATVRRVGLDIKDPDEQSLIKFVYKLTEIEQDYLSKPEALRRRVNRLSLVKRTKKDNLEEKIIRE